MILEVKVQTNSGKSDILQIDDSHYKAHLKSSPEEGKANKELLKLLSKKFKRDVEILRGKTSKNKLIKIKDGN